MNGLITLSSLVLLVLLVVVVARHFAGKSASEQLVSMTRNTLDEPSQQRFDALVEQFKKNNQNQLKIRDLMMLKKQAQM